ncbi:MAG: 3-phosphoshikimate 1-carboxyvinyltransferase [Rhizobacter sp.]|nr:3-phosphoshikimate 1-carboxyvinyltransferase [Ferruginibacter sp.]
MHVTISPSKIKGGITAPASKSAMQRACALAMLHKGATIINNPGASNDDKAALSIIEQLGATIEYISDGSLKITGSNFAEINDNEMERSIHCGESGLSIRMFAPIAALCQQRVSITGSGSLAGRPMDFFDDVFPQLGITVNSSSGKLPLWVQGPLQPKEIRIDGSLSSQFLTGLLFAFAKAATMPVIIHVTGLKSKPYIDLSLHMLDVFGYDITHNNYQSFYVTPGNRLKDQQINYTVEGDWSGASFLLVAGAIAGKITIKGLDVFSAQADKTILQALQQCKANLSITADHIEVSPGALQAFHFNATDCPDLFPPLVALASYCRGTSVIEGVGRLAHKESDRALTLQEEFGKMGVVIKVQDDLMIIEGGGLLKGAAVHSRHDHRIAMATAVAALKAGGETIIEEAEAINKSYPAFYDHLKKLGVALV